MNLTASADVTQAALIIQNVYSHPVSAAGVILTHASFQPCLNLASYQLGLLALGVAVGCLDVRSTVLTLIHEPDAGIEPAYSYLLGRC